MDVHASNEMMFSTSNTKAIHAFIPSFMLEKYNVDLSAISRIYVQTRFHSFQGTQDGAHVAPFTAVYFSAITPDWVYRNQEKAKKLPHGFGLLLSIPLCTTTERKYNPFNVALVRIKMTNRADDAIVPIYYLTLVEGLNMSVRTCMNRQQLAPDLDTGHPSTVSVSPERKNDFIYEIFGTPSQNRADSKQVTPVSMLSSLVRSRNEAIPKHHPALELPSVVRGHKMVAENSTLPPGRVKVVIPFNQTRKKMLASTAYMTKVYHVFTQEPFFIFAYREIENENSPLVSLMYDLPVQDFKSVDVCEVVTDEYNFLFSVADRICETFYRELEKTNWHVPQFIPVTLPSDYDAIYKKLGLEVEAFYIIKTKVNRNSAWIKAGLNRVMGREIGFWTDRHFPWENLESQWGSFTELVKDLGQSYPGGAISNYIKDFCAAKISTSWNCVELVILHDFTALLILPGGFVIKGNLNLSEKELHFIYQRYGV